MRPLGVVLKVVLHFLKKLARWPALIARVLSDYIFMSVEFVKITCYSFLEMEIQPFDWCITIVEIKLE